MFSILFNLEFLSSEPDFLASTAARFLVNFHIFLHMYIFGAVSEGTSMEAYSGFFLCFVFDFFVIFLMFEYFPWSFHVFDFFDFF